MTTETLAEIARDTQAPAERQQPSATTILSSKNAKEYIKSAGFDKIEPLVKESKGKGLYVTFLDTTKPSDSSATSLWFSQRAVDEGLVTKNEVIAKGFFDKFQICELRYDMPDGSIENRTKICAIGESKFVDMSDLL